MDNIVNILHHQPHITGSAKCLSCDHKWTAVVEVGAVDLECPTCHTFKGVFYLTTSPKEFWQCNCGNQHFYIGKKYAMCSRCGTTLDF